jgi:hypothetical protein
MKVPAKYKKWPNVYRWGYEDAQVEKESCAHLWVAEAKDSYEAGYKEGSKS